jgi:hypothetical protein
MYIYHREFGESAGISTVQNLWYGLHRNVLCRIVIHVNDMN